MATYSREEIVEILRNAGIPEKDIPVMVAIAMAESKGDPNAIGDTNLVNSKWDESIGLFQIRSLKNPGQYSGADKLRVKEDLFDPIANAKAAYAISNQGKNWSPWTTYNEGTYKEFMPQTKSSRSRMRDSIKVVGKGKGKVLGLNYFDSENDADLALAESLVKKFPELESIWNAAVDEDITDEELENRLRSTDFSKRYPKQAREKMLLLAKDPATFKALQENIRNQVRQTFETYGATLIDEKTINSLADRAIYYDLSSEELINTVANSIDFNASYINGVAGTTIRDLRKKAASYGKTLPSRSTELKQAAKDIITKKKTIEDIEDVWRQEAIRMFPAFKARFEANATLDDIAEPYKEYYSRILEVDKDSIANYDPTLVNIMQDIDPKNGTPYAVSFTEAEKRLKKDPRWQFTNNAQETILGIMNDIGALFSGRRTYF